MKTKNKFYSCCYIFFLLLTGCSNERGLINSFEDISTEVSKEGGFKVPQYRVISVPGLLPFSEIGGVHFFVPKRKPSTAIGISGGNKSYVIETTIDNKTSCDQGCLAIIRNTIIEVKKIAINLVEDKINILRIRSILLSNTTTKEEKADAKIALNEATDQYNKNRSELDTKHLAAIGSIEKNGIIVFRWNTKSTKNGSSSLGDIFSSSGKKEESTSGFGLMSGLKISSLYLGEDIKKYWANLNPLSSYKNRYEVTTYLMQAQYVIYMSEEDLSSSLSAKLKASSSQLSNVKGTLKSLDNIELQIALSKASNLSNMGVIGNSKRTKNDIDWESIHSQEVLDKNQGWQTVYSIKSDLTDVLEMMSKLNIVKSL